MNLDAQEREARARAQEARGGAAASPPPRADGRPTEAQMRQKAKEVKRLRGNESEAPPAWAIRSWRTTNIVLHYHGKKSRAVDFQYQRYVEELFPELVAHPEQDADNESDAESESDVRAEGWHLEAFFAPGEASR